MSFEITPEMQTAYRAAKKDSDSIFAHLMAIYLRNAVAEIYKIDKAAADIKLNRRRRKKV
jgi:ethanolamine utilization protein EutP (predicted NTPase)